MCASALSSATSNSEVSALVRARRAFSNFALTNARLNESTIGDPETIFEVYDSIGTYVHDD